jgi:DsbC/DsbD-like thiol-disulfide interchange protein
MRITRVLAAITVALAAWSAEGQSRYVKAVLIADTTAIEWDKPFRLGVLFTIPPRAHIYWRYPGDSGLPTSIEWRFPDGFAAGELQWPNPVRFEIPEINDISYGYTGETLLFTVIRPSNPADLAGPFAFEAEAQWLICLEDGECIPERAALRLALPAGTMRPSGHAKAFEKYASRVPISAADPSIALMVEFRARKGRLSAIAKGAMRFTAGTGGIRPGFFPEEGPPWELVAQASEAWSKLEFAVARDDGESAVPAGVLTLPVRHAETSGERVLYLRVGPDEIAGGDGDVSGR